MILLQLEPINATIANTILSLLENTCALLGLPLKVKKREGPSTCLIFLGIELDTEIRAKASSSESRAPSIHTSEVEPPCCTKRDLESLVRQLHNASIVVWPHARARRPGHTFIYHLIDLLKSAHQSIHQTEH